MAELRRRKGASPDVDNGSVPRGGTAPTTSSQLNQLHIPIESTVMSSSAIFAAVNAVGFVISVVTGEDRQERRDMRSEETTTCISKAIYYIYM
jgi:hypothetical protein